MKKGSSFKVFGDGICLLDAIINGYAEVVIIANYYHTGGVVGSGVYTKYFGPITVQIGLLSDMYYGIIKILNTDGIEISNGEVQIYRWLTL